MHAAMPVPDLLNSLYASAAILVDAVADPAAIEDASLKHRADALNAVGRFVALLHKVQGQSAQAHVNGAQGDPAAALKALALAAVHEAAPPANRHERRKRERLLRRA